MVGRIDGEVEFDDAVARMNGGSVASVGPGRKKRNAVPDEHIAGCGEGVYKIGWVDGEVENGDTVVAVGEVDGVVDCDDRGVEIEIRREGHLLVVPNDGHRTLADSTVDGNDGRLCQTEMR